MKFQQREEAYRIYVTDALKVISESASKFAGGRYLDRRYIDTVTYREPPKEQVEDTRSAREFTDAIWERAKKKKGGKR